MSELLPETMLGQLKSTLGLLSKKDQKRMVFVAFIQIFMGLLDLLGVALVGMIAAIAVRGLQSLEPGDRVSQFLDFVNLSTFDFQSQLIILGVSALFVLVLKTVLSIFLLRRTIFYLSRRSASITNTLISKTLNQTADVLQKEPSQRLLFNLTNGVTNLVIGVINNLILMISDFSLLLILSVGLFFVDPRVTTVTLLLFSLIGVSLYYLTHTRASRVGEKLTQISVESNQKIIEAVTSYREIFVKGGREHYVNQISQLRNNLANHDAEMKFLPNISKYVAEISIVLGAVVISATVVQSEDAYRSVGILAVFFTASTRIAPAVMRMQQSAIMIKTYLTSATPTLELAHKLSQTSELSKSVNNYETLHQGFIPDVVINSVRYRYLDTPKDALSQVNLKVNQGSMVAFVGPSGGGKSTLIDLILGVLIPCEGSIRVSGLNPEKVSTTWPGAIGFVPQMVSVHNASIKENICLGFNTDEIDNQEVWEALEAANLREFVETLPGQLNFKIDDSGSNFSGGQLQRLGIARALLSQPKLIIFDEATSSLDAETENRISDAILRLRGKATLIVVAHRLSTIRQADHIYFINDGKILDSGTFNELKGKNSDFKSQASLMGL
jgi:ABC-type multidrug transport system fused ATPase/permease subunit